MIYDRFRGFGLAVGCLAALAMTSAFAQDKALIDQKLEGQLDFRDLAFEICFGEPFCRVRGFEVFAYRKDSSDDFWRSALLYWDPIDGLGILQGGQDDEIDFNERLLVKFPRQRGVDSIWLTDIFRLEDKRYGIESDVAGTEEDLEIAGIELKRGIRLVSELRVSAERELPNTEFNEIISDQYLVTGGDLNYRLIIDGNTLSLLVPGGLPSTPAASVTVEIGAIDPEKKALFDDGEELVYDLTEVFGVGEQIELVGLTAINPQRILEMLDEPEDLQRLRDSAEVGRLYGSADNGEVAVVLNSDARVSSATFFSPTGSTNDFSVAGIVFQGGTE